MDATCQQLGGRAVTNVQIYTRESDRSGVFPLLSMNCVREISEHRVFAQSSPKCQQLVTPFRTGGLSAEKRPQPAPPPSLGSITLLPVLRWWEYFYTDSSKSVFVLKQLYIQTPQLHNLCRDTVEGVPLAWRARLLLAVGMAWEQCSFSP